MKNSLEERLNLLSTNSHLPLFKNIKRGIEKESLRVTVDGQLSKKPHSIKLGSALTHPHITTDFSEALLEFITPPSNSIENTLSYLADIHRFTLSQLDNDELLWTASMPCILPGDENVPLAYYGESNIGKLKTLYRRGLGLRYSRLMQTIAGIHYNFSLPDSFWKAYRIIEQFDGSLKTFKTQQYFNLIRNFHRFSWLLPYLFGASPAICKSFVKGRHHELMDFGYGTLYTPYATSLRMGNLGYKSEAQSSLYICYNDLPSYCASLEKAMKTPYPDYEKIGQKQQTSQGNQYLQINTNLLQLENEFYSNIRPKQASESGKRPIDSLQKYGVEYIEVRCLDLNPYLPLGIDANQIRFLDSFLLFCLLHESPLCNEEDFFSIEYNFSQVVNQGRNPELILNDNNTERLIRPWAHQLLASIANVAKLFDAVYGNNSYSNSWHQQQRKFAEDTETPSAKILKELEDNKMAYYSFALKQSLQHCQHYRETPLTKEQQESFVKLAKQSFIDQKTIEMTDSQSFDDYLQDVSNQPKTTRLGE